MSATVPKVKYKTFTYETNVQWVGNRAGRMTSAGKPSFRVASPPEFRGEAGVWTPEDLFVAAVEACTMTTFLAFADRRKLPLVEYKSHAKGWLEFKEGTYQFTRILLTPVVVIKDEASRPFAEQILQDAHKHCLISNSIKSEVLVEPHIEVR